MKMSVSQALDLAGAHFQAGRLAETETVCRTVLDIAPGEDRALTMLGLVAYHRGDRARATRFFQQAAAINSQAQQALLCLAVIYQSEGRPAEADAAYGQLGTPQPAAADPLNSLGYALLSQGRAVEAEIACRRAIQVNPAHADAWNNLSAALGQLGRIDEAETAARQSLAYKPNHPGALDNLTVALVSQTRYLDAEATCRRLLEIVPTYARAWNALGVILGYQRRPEDAEKACRMAVKLAPNQVEAANNLGMSLRDQGRVEEALAFFLQAAGPPQQLAPPLSNALCCTQYLPDVTPERLLAEHIEWDRRHGQALRASWPAHGNDRDPDRPLRVGFVSPDFGIHPVGQFIVRPLECFDRAECQAICYSSRRNPDSMTARIKQAAYAWCEVADLLDDALARRVMDDRIDVLVDLSGHTSGNRLLAFARKPAPIQVTWMGYTGTTGLAAMDYLLADSYHVQRGEEGFYRERVLRFDHDYICFEPPGESPEVGSLPAAQAGHVTFGSFNNPAKVGRGVVGLWARILDRVPGSRLLLKFNGFDAAPALRRYRGWFGEEGIDLARVEFSGWSGQRELLEQYNRVDVALDPFPYSGGLTTCEALWMGVPVVTCPGRTFAGRHSTSHVSNAGLAEYVAPDREHYADVAVGAVADLERLGALRAGLRARVAASPLCDGRLLAENLTRLLRAAWRQWVAGRKETSA